MSPQGGAAAEGEQRSRGRPRDPVERIYRQLPRGPHRLDPGQIAAHQRARIEGAMVEAVARRGYDGVTVRYVIGLAGVSRRSFYEQFDNRHDCFLKTARTIAARELSGARRSADARSGPVEARLGVALGAIAAGMRARPDASRLVLRDCLAAGEQGAAVLGETLAAAQRMLGAALACEHDTSLPAPIVRALAGALHGMLATSIDGRGRRGQERLVEAMTAIVLALRTPTSGGAATELSQRLHDRARRAAFGAARRSSPPTEAADAREGMLLSAMWLAAHQPVAQLSIPEVADEAGASIDAFQAAFASTESCLEEALASSGAQLLDIAHRAELAGGSWPQATRLALAGMLGHLAANPVQAYALALVAYRAGDTARRAAEERAVALGTTLMRGGPAAGLPAEAAAGAFWHTVRAVLLDGRGTMLAALSDHLAYVVLAPALGAEAAIQALGGPSDARSGGWRST